MFAFFNDAFVPVEKAALPYSDLAVNRGYGIFDFFKTINGKPVFLEEHLERFYDSASQMRLPVAYQLPELKTLLLELINRNGLSYSGVRLTLTGGSSPDGYSIGKPNFIISQQALSPITREKIDEGIRLLTVEHQRQLPAIKTIDYLMPVWLQPQLQQAGADDMLYHQNNLVTECPRANFFILTADGKIATPKTGILQGIIRRKVLNIAQTSMTVEERNISLQEILSAKEAFITSTTKGVLPVSAIDGKQIGTGSRESSTILLQKLEALY